MTILGLHFGHDASISLIKNGKIIFCYEKERHCRLRHAIGISSNDIEKALGGFEYNIKDVDYCSVTSTQDIEYLFFNNQLKFNLDLDKLNNLPNHWYHENKNKINSQIKKKNVINLIKRKSKHPYLERFEQNTVKRTTKYFGSVEEFFVDRAWKENIKLKKLENFLLKNPLDKKLLHSMQLPIKVKIKNKNLPGYIFSHHYAHAAYSFYTSKFNEAAIFTQDGSFPKSAYFSGMCYYGKENLLYPILPHYLNLGRIYESTSELIGFDRTSGPGKAMGLAPYGEPKFYNKRFVGNLFDYKKIKQKIFKDKKIKWKPHRIDIASNKWISHCLFMAKKLKYEESDLGNTKKILSKINVDIASSTQKLLEETMLYSIKKFYSSLKKIKIKTKNLCLSGGTMLNCPANSKISNKKIFKNIFVPPAVHDGGLSIGSALATYYNNLSKKRRMIYGNHTSLGLQGQKYYKKKNDSILYKYRNRIIYKKVKNPYRDIAKNLSNNKIVAVIFGKSEVGPRALGSRSILADPRKKGNWLKVNRIKKREYWRPFAPVIIEKYFHKYFCDSPKRTPFMLFTSRVKSKLIPAVTHVDRTSRVQTVNDKKLPIYKILNFFHKFTNLPILMNTSFNGPGEPIVESLNDGLSFFLKSDINILYFNNFEIKKK